MKKLPVIVLLSLWIFTGISCNSIDESLSHCVQERYIRLKWVETKPITEEGQPVTIDIIPSGTDNQGQTLSSNTQGTVVEGLQTGTYSFVAYETGNNVNVNTGKRTVGVDNNANGFAKEPGLFSAGSTEMELTAYNGDEDIVVPLYKQARSLVIEVTITGTGASRVNNITGVFDGIATQRLMEYGFKPANPAITRPPAISKGKVDYTLAKDESKPTVFFSGSRNLLGIDGDAKQLFDFTLFYGDGYEKPLTIDFTNAMNGFHTEDLDPDGTDNPWVLKIELHAVDLFNDIDVSIEDWQYGGRFPIIAN